MIEKIRAISGVTTEENCDMSAYTTFRIGGKADLAIFPENTDAFVKVIECLEESGSKYFTVGNGSNLLFPDEGYRGAVIITTKLKNIETDGNKMVAEAGASLIKLSLEAKKAGLAGLEFAYGIPGSVGGGIYMNAGAYGGEICQVLESCTCYDTVDKSIKCFDNAECDFSYRNSIFEKNVGRYIILNAEFRLEKGDASEIGAKMEDFMSRRRDKQPLEYPSAGSAFKRAEGYFTAKLIDEAGLKGFSIGGAQVSEKHAGFIINKGGATANDVKALLAHIQGVIYEIFGVEIESEIRIV